MRSDGATKGAPGKAFEQRVIDAYQALGFRVTPNIQLPGKQTDLIARSDPAGAPPIKLAIECKEHAKPIGNDEVFKFVNRVVAQTAKLEITGGAFVSRSGFTADGRAAAAGHQNITLLSWEELSSQIFDVRHQVTELVEAYESQAIFHDYLPLAIEPIGWSSMAPEASSKADGESLLSEWQEFGNQGGLGIILILADFGAGKTTLLRNIEYDRANAYLEGEDSRIPLFVPLREYRQSQDIGTLLRASFRDAYVRDIPTDLLWQRIRAGKFFILLDGFDEMLDRSNARRRLELFHELMPVLRSRSPAILTSRPSYLVERGELDRMLSTIREQEAAIAAPITAGGPHSVAVAERLRRKLVERHREVRPMPGLNDPLNVREVQVIQLLPLDDEQIEEFVARHKEELAEVGASVDDLLAFINRTYDLSDLASRPMLLNLIISSVLIGGLDLSDTSKAYGASSLYEIYTHAKLDLDLAKGRSRQNGLSLAARRMLAEAVAMEMYQKNVLELDFHEVLEKIRNDSGLLEETLEATGFSEEEVRTDFATCSFVTLDRDGKCRFVHKSFRGFFVARFLKRQLPRLHPMLSEALEREVLYFLGNFSPTEPGVGEQLWAKFLRTGPEEVALRRNLLVAFLNTKPNHDTRRVSNAEIADAGFNRLTFEGTRLKDVTWRECTVGTLEVTDAKWKASLIDSKFTEFLAEESDLEIEAQGCVYESWRCQKTNLRLALGRSSINEWRLENATVGVMSDGSSVKELKAWKSDLGFAALADSSLSLADVEMCDSRLRMDGGCGSGDLRAERSVIVYAGAQEMIGEWELKRCLLVLTKAPEEGQLAGFRFHRDLSTDEETVVLGPEGVAHHLLESSAGIFGSIRAASQREPLKAAPAAWGVLEADDILEGLSLPPQHLGLRSGKLLLVRKKDFKKLHLPGLLDLKRIAADEGSEFRGVDSLGQVEAVRHALKRQHEDLLKRKWPVFSDYFPR